MDPVTWREAMQIATQVSPNPPTRVGLTSAVGSVLAQDVVAQVDLPPFDCAAEPGYAVRGFGPWTVRDYVLASEGLRDGEAVEVLPSSALPANTDAVVPLQQSVVDWTAHPPYLSVGDPASGRPSSRPGHLPAGFGIQPARSSALAGEPLIKAGNEVTPGTVGLAAAGGADDLTIIPPPTVTTVVRNEGLLATGAPRRGHARGVLAPLAPLWAMSAGARCLPERASPEEIVALANIITDAGGDLVVVTASARPSSLDVAESALLRLGGEFVITELNCRPGGSILFAELPDGRGVLCLPTDPAAAVVTLALILSPALAALAGKPHLGEPETLMLHRGVGDPDSERAVPVNIDRGELAALADPMPWSGPHGLGPLGTAAGIAFIDPGRGMARDAVPVVRIPGAEQ